MYRDREAWANLVTGSLEKTAAPVPPGGWFRRMVGSRNPVIGRTIPGRATDAVESATTAAAPKEGLRYRVSRWLGRKADDAAGLAETAAMARKGRKIQRARNVEYAKEQYRSGWSGGDAPKKPDNSLSWAEEGRRASKQKPDKPDMSTPSIGGGISDLAKRTADWAKDNPGTAALGGLAATGAAAMGAKALKKYYSPQAKALRFIKKNPAVVGGGAIGAGLLAGHAAGD